MESMDAVIVKMKASLEHQATFIGIGRIPQQLLQGRTIR